MAFRHHFGDGSHVVGAQFQTFRFPHFLGDLDENVLMSVSRKQRLPIIACELFLFALDVAAHKEIHESGSVASWILVHIIGKFVGKKGFAKQFFVLLRHGIQDFFILRGNTTTLTAFREKIFQIHLIPRQKRNRVDNERTARIIQRVALNKLGFIKSRSRRNHHHPFPLQLAQKPLQRIESVAIAGRAQQFVKAVHNWNQQAALSQYNDSICAEIGSQIIQFRGNGIG